jgi:predicted nucleotidyltransferase
MAKGQKTGGRIKGVPNRTTKDVREAIAVFAEANVTKLQGWLDATAQKDPAKAADLFVRVIEYHIPKLARTELSGGKAGEGLDIQVRFISPGDVPEK